MIIETLAGLLALFLFCIIRFKLRSNYWTKLGVKQPAENPFPFGNNPVTCWDRLSGKINVGHVAYEQHKQFAGEKVYGTYMLASCHPAIGIRDPDLIRDVLVKDFGHFVDRGRPLFGTDGHSETDMAWRKQMSSTIGEEWKELRSMFSPIFTSGKLRTMMDLITSVSEDIEKDLARRVEMGGQVELKELFGKFSMDAIASCVFGIDAGSFKHDSKNETEFVKNAKSIFTITLRDGMRFVLDKVPILGPVVNWLRVPFFKPKESAFFFKTVTETIRHRLETGTRRNDLIDLMIEAMTSDLNDEVQANDHSLDQFEKDSALTTDKKKKGKKTTKEINELDIVATAMTMLVAGYDTTAQTLGFVAYQMARNQDMQKRLQEEIDMALQENDDGWESLDYNTVQRLPYLDMVINEALRLHSPGSIISRECTKDYKLRGTDVTIKAGQYLQVSILGVHRDPEFYPEPLKFNPENFSKENKYRAKRSPYTFLGFGQGPRSCIGMRFALLETKVCLARVLAKFSFEECEATPDKVTRDPISVFGNPVEDMLVSVVERQIKDQI